MNRGPNMNRGTDFDYAFPASAVMSIFLRTHRLSVQRICVTDRGCGDHPQFTLSSRGSCCPSTFLNVCILPCVCVCVLPFPTVNYFPNSSTSIMGFARVPLTGTVWTICKECTLSIFVRTLLSNALVRTAHACQRGSSCNADRIPML